MVVICNTGVLGQCQTIIINTIHSHLKDLTLHRDLPLPEWSKSEAEDLHRAILSRNSIHLTLSKSHNRWCLLV